MASLIISLFIFCIFEFCLSQVFKIYCQIQNEIEYVSKEDNKQDNIEDMKEIVTKEEIIEEIWQIEIPKINLVAPISEGTSQEVMLEFVGHFKDTSKWEGNVGLAAHNRGYPINYFSRLKELKNEDEIIYKTEFGTKKYSVETIKIIEDTDWSYLQKTKDNRITLITCVENRPSNRLCIQAIEIREE